MARSKTRGYKLIASRQVACQRSAESICPQATSGGLGRACLTCVTDAVREKLIVARLLALVVRNGAASPLTEAERVVARGLLTEVVDAIDAAGEALGEVGALPKTKIERREERTPSYIR